SRIAQPRHDVTKSLDHDRPLSQARPAEKALWYRFGGGWMTSETAAAISRAMQPDIAVILPCYNEEAAIEATIAGFRAALPDARIYVFDNNSRDRTVEVARAAGAIVRTERMQGKGNVVRRMFSDVEADIYVMADGDATYDALAAPEMIRMMLDDRLDMV